MLNFRCRKSTESTGVSYCPLYTLADIVMVFKFIISTNNSVNANSIWFVESRYTFAVCCSSSFISKAFFAWSIGEESESCSNIARFYTFGSTGYESIITNASKVSFKVSVILANSWGHWVKNTVSILISLQRCFAITSFSSRVPYLSFEADQNAWSSYHSRLSFIALITLAGWSVVGILVFE